MASVLINFTVKQKRWALSNNYAKNLVFLPLILNPKSIRIYLDINSHCHVILYYGSGASHRQESGKVSKCAPAEAVCHTHFLLPFIPSSGPASFQLPTYVSLPKAFSACWSSPYHIIYTHSSPQPTSDSLTISILL